MYLLISPFYCWWSSSAGPLTKSDTFCFWHAPFLDSICSYSTNQLVSVSLFRPCYAHGRSQQDRGRNLTIVYFACTKCWTKLVQIRRFRTWVSRCFARVLLVVLVSPTLGKMWAFFLLACTKCSSNVVDSTFQPVSVPWFSPCFPHGRGQIDLVTWPIITGTVCFSAHW